MKKRRRKGLLGKGTASEDVNPMEGVANLADVMLVFACGLMLALITYWNVDVASATEAVQQRQELTESVTDLDDQEGEAVDSDALQEYGTVYIDKETGALYIISD